jgi:hypothetical protein
MIVTMMEMMNGKMWAAAAATVVMMTMTKKCHPLRLQLAAAAAAAARDITARIASCSTGPI